MSGDTTVQALKRLSWLPDRDTADNGTLIAGQEYYDVEFAGGTISNVILSNVTINGVETQRSVTVLTAAGDYIALTSDYIIVVEKTVPQITTITLPSLPTAGQSFIIKDGAGNSSSFNITVDPDGNDIDGDASYVIDNDYQAVEFVWNGSQWNAVGKYLEAIAGSGTVTSVSVSTANGFSGSVANATTTPAITISTTVSGILEGNGTSISAASTTGSGAVVRGTSPTLVTPSLGAASATSVSVGNTGLTVGSSIPFSDSAGTLTLQNIDALDATTESTIEGAIDTLANLTSIQGQSVTFSGTSTLSGTNTGDQNLFGTIAVSGQSNVVADSTNDTLTLVAGTNITITTNAATDSITINSSGGGSGAFNDITTGTNTTATMTVGTGASLTTSGSGTIAATSAPASGLTGTTLAAGVTGSSLTSVGTISSGTWDGTDIAVTAGGTGRSTSTTAYGLIAAGTTATGALQTLATGSTTDILVSGGASALPVWTTATGSGAPVRATSPTLVTPNLGTPSTLVGTNITGTASGLTAGTATNAVNVGVANEASDTTCFIMFGTAASGNLPVKSNANATFNSSTGAAGFSSVVVGNAGLTVGASTPFSDSAGTLTLQNVDAIDATTETTIEAAIDSLPNLTSASNLATIGTITSGTWNGSTITEPYLDIGDLISAGTNVSITGGGSFGNPLVISATGGGGGGGDVTGPASSSDEAIVRFDGMTGKIIQNSTVTVTDAGIMSIPTINLSNAINIPNSNGLRITDQGGSFYMNITSGETLTGNRILTIDLDDAARTLTLTGNASISGTNTGDQTSVTGNAGTATALQTARNIGGVSFNGTADIVPQTIQIVDAAADTTTFPMLATSATGSLQPTTDAGLTYNASTNALTSTTFIGALTGNASTATSAATLTTARNIGGVSFNGSADIVPQTIQVADAAADTTTFPMLAGSATGNLQPLTDAGLSYNASTNVLTSTFSGNLTGNVTGNADTATTATNATNITLANEATDTTCFVVFGTGATGNLGPKTNANLTFNSSTGALAATTLGGTLTTAAQTNITSVGTLSSLNVGGTLSMGANSITMTGSLAATGSRVTKGWFTDVESTNVPTVGGVALPTASSTTTFTNKRLTPRVSTTASSSTPTPNADTDDLYTVTALAANAIFGAPTGTPVNGQVLIMRIKDNATPRTLAYNAIYRAMGVTLPTTTVASKTLYFYMIYNSTDTRWDITGVAQEA
jgi:hypothetical protein